MEIIWTVVVIAFFWAIVGTIYFIAVLYNMMDNRLYGNLRLYGILSICGPIVWGIVLFRYISKARGPAHERFKIWIEKGVKVDLNEGEMRCEICDGLGEVFDNTDPNDKFKKVGCRKCNGKGKLDWIENARGT